MVLTGYHPHIITDNGTMKIRQVVNSIFNSCTYVLSKDGHSWLVDCGDVECVLPFVEGQLDGVMLTHSHFDHIYGLNRVVELFPGTSIYTNMAGLEGLKSDKLNFSRYHETPFVLDAVENVKIVQDGERIPLFDGVEATAYYTPGHSPCCVTWMVEDALFTGDSLIPGVKTVTNFPHSDKILALKSETFIKNLTKDHHVYPGHAPITEE